MVFNPQTRNGVILQEKRLKLPLLRANGKCLIFSEKQTHGSSSFEIFIFTILSHIFEGWFVDQQVHQYRLVLNFNASQGANFFAIIAKIKSMDSWTVLTFNIGWFQKILKFFQRFFSAMFISALEFFHLNGSFY